MSLESAFMVSYCMFVCSLNMSEKAVFTVYLLSVYLMNYCTSVAFLTFRVGKAYRSDACSPYVFDCLSKFTFICSMEMLSRIISL